MRPAEAWDVRHPHIITQRPGTLPSEYARDPSLLPSSAVSTLAHGTSSQYSPCVYSWSLLSVVLTLILPPSSGKPSGVSHCPQNPSKLRKLAAKLNDLPGLLILLLLPSARAPLPCALELLGGCAFPGLRSCWNRLSET